jgi:hypothetical protein
MTNQQNFMKRYEHRREALRNANARNKDALFDALAGAAITRVCVQFDGEGDQGQIGSVTAFAGEGETDLPEVSVTFASVGWADQVESVSEVKLRDAVEELCYAYLEFEHDGWEINDGSYGDFVFDVAERMITLDFHGRFMDSTLYQHTY